MEVRGYADASEWCWPTLSMNMAASRWVERRSERQVTVWQNAPVHRPVRLFHGGLRVVCVLAGWVVIIAALDLGIGALVDIVRPETDAALGERLPAADATSGGPTSGQCLGTSDLTAELRERAAAPAFAASPWATEYWCEFGRLTNTYTPYLFALPDDTHQPLINIDDTIRHSYEPTAASTHTHRRCGSSVGRPCGAGASATNTRSLRSSPA